MEPWVRKIPWRRKGQSTPVFWEIPWTEEPGRYSPWGHKELDTTEQLTHAHTHTPTGWATVFIVTPTLYRAECVSMLPKCLWDGISRQGRNPDSRWVFFHPQHGSPLPNQQAPATEESPQGRDQVLPATTPPGCLHLLENVMPLNPTLSHHTLNKHVLSTYNVPGNKLFC